MVTMVTGVISWLLQLDKITVLIGKYGDEIENQ